MSRAVSRLLWVAVSAAVAGAASGQDLSPKAIVAIVGDADRFNIGQEGYCGKRAEIASLSNAKFRISAGTRTYFFVRAEFKVSYGAYFCEGDYSFLPEAGMLHIIRYSMDDDRCKLEMFKSDPGSTPQPMTVVPEIARSCLAQPAN